jgi:5'-methylthioadenosine phosphorylase
VEQVFARYGASLEEARRVLGAMIGAGAPDAAGCPCRSALATALVTPEEALSAEKRALLEVLRA